jgi:hypothetical protein
MYIYTCVYVYIYIYIYVYRCQYTRESPQGRVYSPVGSFHRGVYTPPQGFPIGECAIPSVQSAVGSPHWGGYSPRGESPLGSVHYQVGSPMGECTLSCGDSPFGSVHSPVPSGESAFVIVHSPVVSPHWGVDNTKWGLPIGEDKGSFHWGMYTPQRGASTEKFVVLLSSD